MATVDGKQYNPFYRDVDQFVKDELNKRGEFYGSRVRSERVKPGQKGFPEAERLQWSYGKTAYAVIQAGNVILGGSGERVMSDRKGNLTLYDSTRNQPKFPLLQSVELSNEGTIGSLLKGSFSFIVYPDISSTGFLMEKLENAFFKPGKEVTIKYGWSERRSKDANNGVITGIIYNFDWNVQGDLSISAKCSIVSKATIAIGVSGEQTNPDSEGTKTDPLGQPIPDGDMAGILEADVKALGGLNNKSVNTGTTKFYDKNTTNGISKKFDYYVIGVPMSLADVPDDKLTQNQKQKKDAYQKDKEAKDKLNALITKYAPLFKTGQVFRDNVNKQFEGKDPNVPIKYKISGVSPDDPYWGKLGNEEERTLNGHLAIVETYDRKREQELRAEIDAIDPKPSGADITQTINEAKKDGRLLANPPSGSNNSGAKQPVFQAKVDPITHPIYYVKLGDLTEFVNQVLKGSPLGDELFDVQCFGNKTKHLPDIVSSAPERVYFADEKMGTYHDFKPFDTSNEFLRKDGNGVLYTDPLINIGNILISTTAVIETYRSFVKENQTSIEYKNLTGFFDKLIKEVNFASGEMYQLATQMIDPAKGGKGTKAALSIEDMNIASEEVKKVTPYPFTATIAKPILKSVNIGCKPPAASAAAAYTQARDEKARVAGDVSYSKQESEKIEKEFEAAKEGIKKSKESFKANGAGSQFTTGLKGNYAKYKRSSPVNEANHWLTKVLYPIEFSLTIDGIDGFKFGDVIKTNLIPERYNKEGMVFVITKIGHTIQNGVWETTLSTKARIDPGSLKND